jgi:hypothetical protein
MSSAMRLACPVLASSKADVIRLLGEPVETKAASDYAEWISGPSGLRFSDDGCMYVDYA